MAYEYKILQDFLLELRLHDAIYRPQFYSNSLIHILLLSTLHNNVALIQKNRGDKSHRVIVALDRHTALLLLLFGNVKSTTSLSSVSPRLCKIISQLFGKIGTVFRVTVRYLPHLLVPTVNSEAISTIGVNLSPIL